MDEDGKPLADTVTVLSNVNTGTSYNTDIYYRRSTITANDSTYTLKGTQENNTSGTVTEGTTTVTYIYTKQMTSQTPENTETTTTTTTPTEQPSENKSQHLAKTGSNVLALDAAAAALSALGIGVVVYRRMRA